jgi:hypothetical protein
MSDLFGEERGSDVKTGTTLSDLGEIAESFL